MRFVFFLSAGISVLAVLLICVFLFANGVPAIREIGVSEFLLGKIWKPSNNLYGIFPMIVGSLYVTAGAILVGVPTGVLTAVFLARFCPKKAYKILKPAVDLLAGIPSVVYGFFGLMVIVPFVRNTFGGSGTSWLAASLVLGIMILPTVIGVSEAAIRAVPDSYYEGSLALGATHERSVFRAVLPAAKSGILSSVILGVGRRDWGNDGGDYGRRQPGGFAFVAYQRTSYADRQYCFGNGLRRRPPPRSADCHGGGAVCLYFAD